AAFLVTSRRRWRSQEERALATETIAPARAASSAPKVETAPSGSAGEPVLVTVAVRASPSFATITLDGRGLAGNPFRAELPRDSRVHVLRASAPGFAPVERMVTFASDTSVEIALTRARAVRHGELPVAGRNATGESQSTPKATAQPGMDLEKSPSS